MKLVKLIANLGYGSRKEVTAMFRSGRITDANGEVLYADDQIEHDQIRIDDEPLDPAAGVLLMLHKPVGYTVRRSSPMSAGLIAIPAACCCSLMTEYCCIASVHPDTSCQKFTKSCLHVI